LARLQVLLLLLGLFYIKAKSEVNQKLETKFDLE